MDYYKDVLRNKYAVFSGRATRSEFWYFALFNGLVSIAISIIGTIAGDKHGLLGNLYSLAVLVPSIAVGVRRLHDTGKSAWWFLLCLLPIIGWIWLIVLYVTDSSVGENKYGPNLKEAVVIKV